MTNDRLYDLLPAIHRWRDTEQGNPLRDLLRVIGEQVGLLETDIDRLYDNWFIETANDWVVPYLADLIGYVPVAEAGLASNGTSERELDRLAVLVPRRDVANTLRHRRRKGTVAVLEELALDVADSPARAVETARLLGWTQALNHRRPERGRVTDLRSIDALDRLNGAFDELAHTVDVRRVDSHRTTGRWNLPEMTLFIWRLRAYPLTRVPAYLAEQAGRNCFTFSILGNDTPLFVHPVPEVDEFHLAEEQNVPAPIRRSFLLHAPDTLYGEGRSLAVWAPDWPDAAGPQPIPVERIVAADLTDWRYRPRTGTIAVDPALGRVMFPVRQPPKRGVRLLYHAGFSGDIGGGEYDRPVERPSPWAAADVTAADLVDAPTLLRRLRAGTDALAAELVDRWSNAHRTLLQGWDPDDVASPPAELVDALIAELDLAVGADDLYDGDRFVGAPPDLVAAALERPEGLRLALVNRRLLEWALDGTLGTTGWLRRAATTAELRSALSEWHAEAPRTAAIELVGSEVYSTPIDIELAAGQELAIRAAPRTRPVLWLVDRDADRPDSLAVRMGPRSRFTLDGVLVTGRAVHIEAARPAVPSASGEASASGDPATDGPSAVASPTPDCPDGQRVVIAHCTLVPGWTVHHDCEPVWTSEPSLELVDLGTGCVIIDHTILGPIEVTAEPDAEDPVHLRLADSILDATSPERLALRGQGGAVAHADLSIARVTVFGSLIARAIDLAENCIFEGQVVVARRQVGCVRYSYVTPGSRTPRRHACQPDLVEGVLRDAAVAAGSTVDPATRDRERDRVRPRFTAMRYGRPAYAQLSLDVADEIARGADDESELGAFHDLYQPQRQASLAVRLDEFTVAGMDAGIVCVT